MHGFWEKSRMAPHSLTPQHYGAGEIDIKNSLKVLHLQWDCVKELEKPQGERRGLCSNCGTRPSITRLGNLGGHKIRNRYAVHYILTSLRSGLQSPITYQVFLPLSDSSPNAFSENIEYKITLWQGGTSWLAFGERKIIPQSFRRARICKFSRQKTLFFTIA